MPTGQSKRKSGSSPVALTSKELDDAAQKLRANYLEADSLEEECKAVAKQFKAKIEGLHVENRALSERLADKKEIRPTPCLWKFECEGYAPDGTFAFHNSKKTLFRVLSWIGDEEPKLGEVVEIADIADPDRERSLPLEGL